MKINGAVLVAVAAAMGNLLQGWDNATIAGAVLYIKREFHLEIQPAMEGLVVATSLVGATIITIFSGAVADLVGRRSMLIASSIFYSAGSIMMLWSPTVYVLLFARLVDGFGVGLAVTIVPVYISETAPPEIRGQLNTLPQFTGSGGMFISYCMIFAMTLVPNPNWRIMLGALLVPSFIYLILSVFYLPESPRWLVSKGRMEEARAVLEMLRGSDDVSGEMALLVEGLGTSGDTDIEQFVVGRAESDTRQQEQSDAVTLYGSGYGQSWVAQPVASSHGSKLGIASDQCSMFEQMKDPVVSLLGSVHKKPPESSGGGNELEAPLLLSETTDLEQGSNKAQEQKSLQRLSSMGGNEEAASNMGIGGGWQLAWKWTDMVGSDGVTRRGVNRVYMHEDSVSADESDGDAGEYVHASALVSRSMLYPNDVMIERSPTEPALANPPETVATKAAAAGQPGWREILEPGVRRALLCGVMIQILQQFSGINGVLYYTPQILDQAGVSVLLASLGLSADSTSILISGLTTLLMLPSIGVAMRLMDVSGRRSLLLWTIPVLVLSLLVLIVANLVPMATTVHAALSTGSVIVYFCCFVMGFGPIPNILCSEIFPTRVRGICIAICAMTFWMGDIVVTYSLPLMLSKIGLAGVFAIYAVVCCVALIFVALKVPETKGLPLEVIIDFFNVGTKRLPADANLDHD